MMDKGLVRAKKLIDYIEMSNGTPRAVVPFCYFVQFSYLAGLDVSLVPPELLRNRGPASLHIYDVQTHIKKADDRMKRGLVPEDWDETLERIFEEKGVILQEVPSS